MRVIREDTVRQLHLKQGLREIRVERDAYVTHEARDYIRDKRLRLVVEGETPENPDIHPAPTAGRWVTTEGAALGEKPEHMTHLYGNVLVVKNHPRIVLRGRLDSLEAEIISVQVAAVRRGEDSTAEELQQLLEHCRQILSSEVTGRPLEAGTLLGLDAAGLRWASQHPKECFSVGHLLPDYRLGALCADLNRLRTLSREAELIAVDAFCTPEGGAERPDLLRAMNRLSSAFYILMLRRAAEQGKERTRDGAVFDSSSAQAGKADPACPGTGAVCASE